MRIRFSGIVVVLVLFSACDGPYYKVTVEFVADEECYGDWEEKEQYDPNLVDPYSEDTNWYIDEMGNIVWRK